VPLLHNNLKNFASCRFYGVVVSWEGKLTIKNRLMHLDKKREEQLEKIEFELEKEYDREATEEQKSPEIIIETESEKEKTGKDQQPGIEPTNPGEVLKKKKRDLFFELTLFFILGALIGITLKTEAVKKITIGFNDYQIPAQSVRYDVAELKRNLLQKAAEQQQQQQPTVNNQ